MVVLAAITLFFSWIFPAAFDTAVDSFIQVLYEAAGLDDFDMAKPTPLFKGSLSFATSLTSLSSLITIMHFYVAPTLILILLYLIFHSFTHGDVLTRRVAFSICLLSICLVSYSAGFDYQYLETTTKVDEEKQSRTYRTTSSMKFYFLPNYILESTFLLSLGLAIRYGAQIQEENNLTI